MFYNGTWGPVCGDYYWDLKHASIVCRQLGFPEALVAATTPAVGRVVSNKRKMWFKSQNCLGSETSLTHCLHSGWSSYCYGNRNAYITCVTGINLFYLVLLNSQYRQLFNHCLLKVRNADAIKYAHRSETSNANLPAQMSAQRISAQFHLVSSPQSVPHCFLFLDLYFLSSSSRRTDNQ